MKIAIVTDAWRPQTNGVVQTLSTTAQTLRAGGHEVMVVEPNQFSTFPCPTYPEIRLSWLPYKTQDGLVHRVLPGNLFTPFHWNDLFGEYLAINAVTNDAVDPISYQPELKVCAVALTKSPHLSQSRPLSTDSSPQLGDGERQVHERR